MKRYRVIYPNKITQEKNLLTEDEYNQVKNLKSEIYDLEQTLGEINKRKKIDKWNEINNKIKELKSQLSIFEEYFILDSPLGKALLNNGHLILPTYKEDGSKKDYYPTLFEELE